jgi:TPR repeat protein
MGLSSKDPKEAFNWFMLAAKQGHVYSQVQVGVMYSTGHGVVQDYGESVKWLELAAKQGDCNAQMILGMSYVEGLGVTKDLNEALSGWNFLLRTAINQ